MKKTTLYYITFMLIPFALLSCKGEALGEVDLAKDPIVTVGKNTLYKSELENAMPRGLSQEDSTASAKAYVQAWINEELLYNKAKQNVIDKKQIEELVDDYKRSLTVNLYQEYLLNDRLAKSIPESDLKAYYEENPERFTLKENIIKGLYLKIPLTSPELKNFEKWYKQSTDDAIENIEKNTLQNAVGYEYFYDRWVDMEEVMENIPLLITDSQQFLKTNKNVEVRDSTFSYLLNIKEYKIVGSQAPYEYIKGQLTEIFIEKKKADYLKQIEQDLYNKALSGKGIKFYDK